MASIILLPGRYKTLIKSPRLGCHVKNIQETCQLKEVLIKGFNYRAVNNFQYLIFVVGNKKCFFLGQVKQV
jgi:hypothetical protein